MCIRDRDDAGIDGRAAQPYQNKTAQGKDLRPGQQQSQHPCGQNAPVSYTHLDPEGYTVNDVYGLVGSCWKPAQLSDDIETDVKEDYALALQKEMCIRDRHRRFRPHFRRGLRQRPPNGRR